MSKSLSLIAYDITSNKRRRKLMKLAEAFGIRVQFSVFEAMLDQKLCAAFLKEAEKILDLEAGDALRIYPICAECSEKAVTLGGKTINWKEAYIV